MMAHYRMTVEKLEMTVAWHHISPPIGTTMRVLLLPITEGTDMGEAALKGGQVGATLCTLHTWSKL